VLWLNFEFPSNACDLDAARLLTAATAAIEVWVHKFIWWVRRLRNTSSMDQGSPLSTHGQCYSHTAGMIVSWTWPSFLILMNPGVLEHRCVDAGGGWAWTRNLTRGSQKQSLQGSICCWRKQNGGGGMSLHAHRCIVQTSPSLYPLDFTKPLCIISCQWSACFSYHVTGSISY
jgi:hypothetical protein